MIRYRRCAAIIVCLFCITASSLHAADTNSPENDTTSWPSKNDSSSTLYKLEKKSEKNLLQLKGTATDRKYTGTDTGTFGLEALFGHLFAPGQNEFKGYSFFSGKLRSDSTQRFNATLGYFPPQIGGELKMTYRLLHAEVHQNMPITGEFEENALEQGLAVYYKKYTNMLLREFAFNYAFTHMGGESDVTGPYTIDTPTSWRQGNVIRGFGDTETHNALLELAFGSDAADLPLASGYRVDLGGGYQRATYGEFHDISELTDDGLTGRARIQVCTPIGVLIGAHENTPSADTNYGGYKLGGLEAYYKKIDYEHSDTQEIIGLTLTFDILNPGSLFDTTCMPFFHTSTSGYSSPYEMSHITGMASDEFTAQKVNEILDTRYEVNKAGLPDNVRIDTTGGPKLVVTTTCQQVGIRSVTPADTAPAFSHRNNEIYIDIAGLPAAGQTVVALFDDSCCGDTRVTVATGQGSQIVDSVNVREMVGCIPLLPDGSACSTDSQCQSGLCGSSGTCGGDMRDGCSADSQCKTGLCGSSGTCGGDLRDGCTIDSQCKVGICGSTGTCGGDIADACTVDSECKVSLCGSSGTCGGDIADICILDSECKAALCGSSGTCGGDPGDTCAVNGECKSSTCAPVSTPPAPLQCL